MAVKHAVKNDTKPDTNSSEALKMRRYGRVA